MEKLAIHLELHRHCSKCWYEFLCYRSWIWVQTEFNSEVIVLCGETGRHDLFIQVILSCSSFLLRFLLFVRVCILLLIRRLRFQILEHLIGLIPPFIQLGSIDQTTQVRYSYYRINHLVMRETYASSITD